MTNLIRLPPTTTMTAQQALESALVDAESNHLKDVMIATLLLDGKLTDKAAQERTRVVELANTVCPNRNWKTTGSGEDLVITCGTKTFIPEPKP